MLKMNKDFVNYNLGAKIYQNTDNRQVQLHSLENTDLGDFPSIDYKSEKMSSSQT